MSTTDITDAGVRHLSGVTEMRHLRIKETRVTDVGLGHLAPMSALETINVRRLDITDEGLLRLAEHHRRLEMLVLSDELAEGRFSLPGWPRCSAGCRGARSSSSAAEPIRASDRQAGRLTPGGGQLM